MTLLILEELKTIIKLDEFYILSYFYKNADWDCWKEDYWWKLGIHLNQHNVYVGDVIDGEVGLFLPSRYLCGRRNFEFYVDGKLLPLNKEGIPYYKTVANKIGKKKLNVECRILNPLTQEIYKTKKEYSIIVMPKPENQ